MIDAVLGSASSCAVDGAFVLNTNSFSLVSYERCYKDKTSGVEVCKTYMYKDSGTIVVHS